MAVTGAMANQAKAQVKRRAAVMLASLVISIAMALVGTLAVAEHDLFHIIENRIEQSLVNKLCSGITAAVSEEELCSPTESLQSRFKGWAKEKLSSAWDAVKKKFGSGTDDEVSVDEGTDGEGIAVASEEVNSSTDDRAPPAEVEGDYASEGDLSPPDEQSESSTTTDPELVEGEPGSTVDTEVPETPADTAVAGGAETPATAVEDAGVSGVAAGDANSYLSGVGKRLTKIINPKAAFTKGNLAMIGAAVLVGVWASSLGPKARQAGGASGWLPTEGGGVLSGGAASDTQAAVENCNTTEYLQYMTSEPSSPLAEDMFWGYYEGSSVSSGPVQIPGGLPVTVNAPKFSDNAFGMNDQQTTYYSDLGGEAVNPQGLLGSAPLEKCMTSITALSACKNTPDNISVSDYLALCTAHPSTEKKAVTYVENYVTTVNKAFAQAESQGFQSILEGLAAQLKPGQTSVGPSLADTYFILGVPAGGDFSLQGLYTLVGPEGWHQMTTVDGGNYAALAASLCGAQGPNCSAVTDSLTDLQTSFGNLENLITCSSTDACSSTPTASQQARAAQLDQALGQIEAAFPTGPDLLAAILTTTNAKGQLVVRTNSAAYQQMMAQLTGAANCGLCAKNPNGTSQPMAGAYLTYLTVSEQAARSTTRAALTMVLKQAMSTCHCSSLLPPTPTGNTSPSNPDAHPVADSTSSVPSDQYTAMMMALTDVIGNYNITAGSDGAEVQGSEISPQGNQGIVGLLPSQFAAGITQAPPSDLGGGSGTVDMGISDQYTAASMQLMQDLKTSDGDVLGAFEIYVRQNDLPPMDGRWASDAQSAINEGWGSAVTGIDGQTGHVSTAALLADVYDQYLTFFQASVTQVANPTNAPTVAGYAMPDTFDTTAIDQAAAAFNLDPGLLFAIGNNASQFGDSPTSDFADSLALCSIDTEEIPKEEVYPSGQPPNGANSYPATKFWTGQLVPTALYGLTVPTRYGVMGMTPQQFMLGYLAVNKNQHVFPSGTVKATPIDGNCPDFGEPAGMLNSTSEIWALAGFLSATREDWQNLPNFLNTGSTATFTANPVGYVDQSFGTRYGVASDPGGSDQSGSGIAAALLVYLMWDDYTPDGQLFSPYHGGLPESEGPGPNNSGNPTAADILTHALADFPNGTTLENDVWPQSSGGSGWSTVAMIAAPLALGVFCPECLVAELIVNNAVLIYSAAQIVQSVYQLANLDLSSTANKLKSVLSQNLMNSVGGVEALSLITAPVYDLWEKSGHSLNFKLPLLTMPGLPAGQPQPPEDLMPIFTQASTQVGVPLAFLLAIAAQEHGFDTTRSQACSGDWNKTGPKVPNSYGLMQIQPTAFAQYIKMVPGMSGATLAAALKPLPTGGPCPDYGEPSGELNSSDEIWAAAEQLYAYGARLDSGFAQLDHVAFAWNAGPSEAYDPTYYYQADVVGIRYPAYLAWLTGGGTGTTSVEAYGNAGNVFWHEVETYPQAAVNVWGGAQTSSATSSSGKSWGQCTWFANSNFYRELGGNGGYIYADAVKEGIPTAPPSQIPPVGAVVSLLGASYGAGTGHTAVVVYSDPSGHYYIVAEANFSQEVATRGGQTTVGVDMREIPFPDAQLQGSVLPRKTLPVPVLGDLQKIIAANGKIPEEGE